MLYVRKVRRKCNVRGCRCIDSYAISWTKEAGNTIIACKKCLEEAVKEINALPEGARSNLVPVSQPKAEENVPASEIKSETEAAATAVTEVKDNKKSAAKKAVKKK